MREIKFRAWDKREGKYFQDWSVIVNNDEDYELQQYTGLKDKNGKEIYEGDICRWFGKYVDVIIWENQSFQPIIGDSDIEVIGNIYENPELLNKTI